MFTLIRKDSDLPFVYFGMLTLVDMTTNLLLHMYQCLIMTNMYQLSAYDESHTTYQYFIISNLPRRIYKIPDYDESLTTYVSNFVL